MTQFLLNMINEEHLQMHLTVCIATDYGRLMLPEHKALTVLASRLNEQEMEKLMSKMLLTVFWMRLIPTLYLSLRTSGNAAAAENIPYIRVIRPDSTPIDTDSNIVFVHTMQEAVSYLAGTKAIFWSQQAVRSCLFCVNFQAMRNVSMPESFPIQNGI